MIVYSVFFFTNPCNKYRRGYRLCYPVLVLPTPCRRRSQGQRNSPSQSSQCLSDACYCRFRFVFLFQTMRSTSQGTSEVFFTKKECMFLLWFRVNSSPNFSSPQARYRAVSCYVRDMSNTRDDDAVRCGAERSSWVRYRAGCNCFHAFYRILSYRTVA